MPPPSSWMNRLAIVPIPVLALAIVSLWVADVRVAWGSATMIWLVHYGPVALGVAFIVIPAARSFLANGQPSILMLGCGVLMMDIGVTVMPSAFARSSDSAFAIYNTSTLLGALCHFAGVAITSRRQVRLKRSAMWLTATYTCGVAVMGLVIRSSFAGWMPAIFVDGQGGTLLRSLVVGTTVALFLLTAGLLWQTNRRTPSPFLYWYALGLILLGAGLAGSMVITVKDSPLQWVTRLTQVVATVYMCVAVLASARETNGKAIPLAALVDAWRENAFLASLHQQTPLGWVARYCLAVVALAAAWGLRLALEAWVGPGLPTYVTFYPAVMAVALLAGFRPGLLATALAGLAVAYWILPPTGRFAIASPVDRLGLVIFGGMGLFMSVVAELYRRNRDKAAAYDREATLRESREALRRQAELIDPVRAEIIAREMQRIVRQRGGAATPSPEPASETLRRVPTMTGAVVAAIGMLVLLGWAIDVNALKSVLPGLATMKANTALCFLLSGIALALRDRRAVRLTGAAITMLVAALSLGEYVLGRDFGIDQLLFHDPGDPHTVPGRMAQATAVAFLFTSGALTLLTARSRAGRWAQQVFGVGTSLIGLATLLGYAYQAQQLYAIAGLSSVALPTAAALVALGGGLVYARSDGLISALLACGPGAQLAGRLLPAALLVPILFGWLHVVGEQTGIFASPMGAGLFALGMVVSLAALVFWSADTLSRADAARRETEIQLRNQAEVMDHAHDALIVREMNGVIRSWNRGAEKLYGWSAAEVVGQSTQGLLHTPASVVRELETALEKTGHWEGELVHTTRGGRRVTVESRKTATRTEDGRVLVLESNRDISERKQAEGEREITVELLRLANQSNGLRDLVRAAVAFFRQQSGCEAVGVRLREGEDYPYYQTHGFPPEFVRMENHLCVRDSAGRVLRDTADDPLLACMCGNIICGRFNPAKPFFSSQGSFWTNCTTELLATSTEADRQARTRNRCNGEGYESVALIALRAGGETLGLLQLNDKRSGRFTPELIALWERLAGYLAVAVAKLRAEDALRRSQKTLAELVERSPFGTYIVDSRFRIAMMNTASQEGAFRNVRPVIGRDFAEAMRILWPEPVAAEIIGRFRHTLETGEPYLSPRFINPRNDVEIVESYEWELHRMTLPDGQHGVICYYYDSTKLRDAEAALRASLAEKEVLLKEIHHRVKNNMQVISSLVDLQAGQLKDEAMRAVLQDVTHRVRSMALVHEKLYQSADMARVEFAEYAQSLLNYLWRAHGTAASGIRLTTDLEPVPLSVNTAVPCGLILNELATNALKHAFPKKEGERGSNCEIRVTLKVGSEGRVCLSVRDSGTGMPAGVDWRHADSLGLRLVQILAKQLSAAVEVQSGEGTEFSVSFGGPSDRH